MTANIRSLGTRIWKGRWGYFFIAPGYIALVAFMLWPLLFAIELSFYKASFNLSAREFVGFQQYIGLVDDPVFRKAFVNTLKYAVVLVPASVLVSLAIALAAYPLGLKAQSFYRGAFYIPGVAGGVILSVVWLWMFNPTIGLANYVLGLVGIEPVLWMGSSKYSFWSVCMVVMMYTVGVPIVIFMAGLANLPQSVLDAATVDGVNTPQRIWHIILPLLRPVMLLVVATQTIGVFQIYETILMLTAGGPSNSSTSMVYRIYQVAFIQTRYGKASAMGVVLLFMVAVVTFLQIRFWDRGELTS
jgi:ABC-type sugar transport system permease subunit